MATTTMTELDFPPGTPVRLLELSHWRYHYLARIREKAPDLRPLGYVLPEEVTPMRRSVTNDLVPVRWINLPATLEPPYLSRTSWETPWDLELVTDPALLAEVVLHVLAGD